MCNFYKFLNVVISVYQSVPILTMKKSIRNILIILFFSLSFLSVIYIHKTEIALDGGHTQIEFTEPSTETSINSITIAAVLLDKVFKVLTNDYLEA